MRRWVDLKGNLSLQSKILVDRVLAGVASCSLRRLYIQALTTARRQGRAGDSKLHREVDGQGVKNLLAPGGRQ